jgi:hypothetical protein
MSKPVANKKGQDAKTVEKTAGKGLRKEVRAGLQVSDASSFLGFMG